VSIKHRLRNIVCCTILEGAALIGVPMRPGQIEDLLRSLHTPTVARTTPDDRHYGSWPPIQQAASQAAANDEAELRALQQQLARGWVEQDRSTLERILAPEWSLVASEGTILTRAEAFDLVFVAKVQTIQQLTIDEIVVTLYGSTAVVRGRASASTTFRGAPYSLRNRFTDVCIKRAGAWQVVASHQSLAN
jgi:Domain of unknown function (DUF4440)